MKKKHKILFVDDEKNILNSLSRLFEDYDYHILTATSGSEGLQIIEENSDISLIVSDFRMPGMDGVEFLTKASEINALALRVMLTGYADIEIIIEAINQGQIYRFISKPWNNEEFPLIITNCLNSYDIMMENKGLHQLTIEQNVKLKDLNLNLKNKVEARVKEINEKNAKLELYFKALSKSFFDTVKLVSRVMEMADENLGIHSKQVAKLAVMIAKYMDLPKEKVRDIEIASLLHDVGKMNASKDTLFKSSSMLTNEQLVKLRNHPVSGCEALSSVDQLKNVAQIILQHHEYVDGSGYPGRRKSYEILIEAKILAVADVFDNLTSGLIIGEKKMAAEDALKNMQKVVGTLYDQDVVFALNAVLPRR